MMLLNSTRSLKTTTLSLVIAAVVTGCSKQEDAAETGATTEAATTATANAPAAPSAAEVEAAQRAFAQADAALKAREYTKAVDAMLAAQQRQLTEQQSIQSRNRMIQLQSALAGAAANGDANAQAAIQKLRAAATYR